MILDFNKNAFTFGKGVFLFFCLIVIDQYTKYSASPVFHNSAFAFSLPLPVWLIYIIYAIVILGMLVHYAKNYSQLENFKNFAWVLIFAGATSNVGERIVLGYVRDWIYIWTGVFNLADGYIIIGVLVLLFCDRKNSKLQIPNFK